MFNIKYKDKSITCRENETVLNAFFRNRIDVPFSCRKGTCQVCVLKVVEGVVPDITQKGLNSHLIKSNHFLPCQCVPESDMVLSEPLAEELFIKGRINGIKKLCSLVCQVEIQLPYPVDYKTGQFINIQPKNNESQQSRSYSITSLSKNKQRITIDVQLIRQGVFSDWVFNHAKTGDDINLQIPLGNCYHSNDMQVTGKLIATSGSGLGAGLAIAAEALENGYLGEVKLCHFSRNPEGWYHTEQLKEMSQQHANFEFWQATDQELQKIGPWLIQGLDVTDVEMYLFGSKNLVNALLAFALESNFDQKRIHYDSFDFKNLAVGESLERMNDMEFLEEAPRYNTEDSKMWTALREGRLLRDILNDFYAVVFDDELLSPFFKGVTKNHVIGKQFSFLQQYYQGGDMYFGDRPRNAHHWMVISDELFDHREKLFKNSCVKLGLKDPYLTQLLDLNESYRKHIVKTRVWPRIKNGVIEPIKGFEELVLDIGGLCDGCGEEIPPHTTVQFHGQTGEMFCPNCSQ